jgi:hypothetical protein
VVNPSRLASIQSFSTTTNFSSFSGVIKLTVKLLPSTVHGPK